MCKTCFFSLRICLFFLVWGSLGAHQHCFRDIREHKCHHWKWCCPNIRPTSHHWWWRCPWTGIRLILSVIMFLFVFVVKETLLDLSKCNHSEVSFFFLFSPEYRLFGHWETLLETPQDAVILSLISVPWCLFCCNSMRIQETQCWGMLHGRYQTSVEESRSLHLIRFASRVYTFNIKFGVSIIYFNMLFSLHFMTFEQTKPCLPDLQRLIQTTDEEVLTDACWALSYLSDSSNDKIEAVIAAGVVPRLIELLAWVSDCVAKLAMFIMLSEMLPLLSSYSHSSPTVLIPALRTIGNIVTGDDQQTQVLIYYIHW